MLGGDEDTFRELLQSIVDVARTIFGAEAASIFLYDEEADELVFEAVSGRGEGTLVGARFPSSTGIAGFALVTRQPLVVDDLDADPRFSRDRAEATGYVPTSIVASPLLHDERALGVLSVLDRAPDRPFGLAELELLSRFSTQAAIGLDLLLRARRAARRSRATTAARRSSGASPRSSTRRTTTPGAALLEALERVLRVVLRLRTAPCAAPAGHQPALRRDAGWPAARIGSVEPPGDRTGADNCRSSAPVGRRRRPRGPSSPTASASSTRPTSTLPRRPRRRLPSRAARPPGGDPRSRRPRPSPLRLVSSTSTFSRSSDIVRAPFGGCREWHLTPRDARGG